jgi:hypothetical protein
LKLFPEPEPASNPGEIVSPSEENMTLVTLQGEGHSREFWSQPSAVAELDQQLRAMLCTTRIFEGVEFRTSAQPPSYQQNGSGSGSKGDGSSSSSWRGFGSKKKKKGADVPLAHPPKNSFGVELSVDREDVVMRTVSPFGLYETVTKPGIVVRIEIIC